MYPEHVQATINHPEISLYKMLEQSTEQYKDKISFIFEGTEITYAQLKDRVDRLAHAWHKLGFEKGERIGLMLGNSPFYVYSYYAAMKLGLIVVQINPYYTLRELLKITQDANLNYLVAEKENLQKVQSLQDVHELAGTFYVDGTVEGAKNIAQLIEENEPLIESTPIDVKEDVAVIQYTGGTTGEVKGAMLTHYNLVANVEQTYTLYKGKMQLGEEIVLTATPLYHVYGMTSSMNFGIYVGAKNLLMRRFKLEEALCLIKEHRPSYFPGVPGMYSAFVNHPDIESYGLDSLKYCSCGSAPLPIEIIKKFESLTNAVIGEGFGLTESSPTAHRNPPGGVRKIGSVGIPVPSTDSKVINEDGTELAPGLVGELLIKGPQVMKGYWNNPEETEKALREGWLYTGDLARQDEDGYFYIVGRKKEMIIIGGFNIYPQEVENVIYEFPNVKEVAVVGITKENKEEVAKAFVVPTDGNTIDLEDLIAHCYQNLTPYKVPKEFEIIEALPRNSVGKILKRKLVEDQS